MLAETYAKKYITNKGILIKQMKMFLIRVTSENHGNSMVFVNQKHTYLRNIRISLESDAGDAFFFGGRGITFCRRYILCILSLMS